MSDIQERFERITGQFTERVRAVPPGGWENSSPCEGWTARDVVRHLTDWIPAFFSGQGVSLSRISMLEMRSNTGEIMRLTQAELAHPFWVSAGRTQLTPTGLVNKDIVNKDMRSPSTRTTRNSERFAAARAPSTGRRRTERTRAT